MCWGGDTVSTGPVSVPLGALEIGAVPVYTGVDEVRLCVGNGGGLELP